MSANPFTLIGLVGRAGVGKDTAAEHLVQQFGFHRWAFAEPLRTMLEALLVECDLDHAYLFEPQLKEQPIPGLGFSYRQLAQTLGTEWGRALASDFWLRCADRCLGLHDDPAQSHPVHDRIVFSDVRFPNEAEWIRRRGGFLVRVQRPGTAAVRAHCSEDLADSISAEHEVWNTGGLDHLQQQLDALLDPTRQGATA